MSDRVSFPLLAIVVDTHPGDQNSAPRIQISSETVCKSNQKKLTCTKAPQPGLT